MIPLITCTLLSLLGCFSRESDPVATKLAERIYKINNQYYYGEKVNTYLIELEHTLLLFDIPTHSAGIEAFILSFKKPAVAVLSHGSCGIKAAEQWQEQIGLKVYLHRGDINHPWLRMRPDVLFDEVPFFAENIEVIHTPGHSAGSVCLLEKKTRSLFTGDTFYGTSGGEVKDFTQEQQSWYENLDDRINSCRKLLEYDFEVVYPFHYEIIKRNARDRLQEFLAKQ